MRRRTHRRLVLAGQLLLLGGLGLAVTWNVVSLVSGLLDPGWWGLILALPGLLLWLGALTAPHLLARAVLADDGETFRLVYDAPDGWQDDTARAALRALARSARLSITWARDGAGTGCWLAVPEGWGEVLRRLVGDVFPGGQVEADRPPTPGEGVVILHWQGEAPAPADLCRLEGVEGVYYRWRDERTATVALWGPGSRDVARQWAKRSDLLPGQGDGLCRPPFSGGNPWPGLPPFPPSQENPGLAAKSRLERLAPALRVNGSQALVLGRDAEHKAVGFALPDLAGMESLWILGQAAESAAVDLACQAVQAGLPTLFLDGRGTATARMAQRLLRETAAGRALLCDVERPAQTRFRLNPLWLPTDVETWPRVLSAWLDWLREMGVTPAGLGRAAYRHTRVTVILTALAAAGSELALDIPRLRDALDAPDFLPLLDEATLPYAPRDLLGAETWDWWLAEGRTAPNFDVHLRLGHLHDRLNALLALPEYGVLWQAPYLDPLGALSEGGVGLFWRLLDPRRRLRAYVTSQLLALVTLLAAWPVTQPVLIVLHELDTGPWARRLSTFPAARLVFAADQATSPVVPEPTARLVSRLDRESAEVMVTHLPGVRAVDLRRLPPTRLVLRRERDIGTLDLQE